MSRSSQRAEQEIKVTGDLHRLNVDYARNSAYMKAHRLLVGDLLRALRTSKFLRAVFNEGVQRYERLVGEKRAGDEARIHTALSDVGGALESWIKDEHRVLLHIFYEDVGVADRRLSMVETFCATSRSIARRGEPEDAQQVLHQWEKAKVQADHMWTPYRNEERRIERNLQDMDQAFMDLETIRLTSYREYSKQDVLNVVACSLVFERVAREATELLAQTGGIAAVMQTGEAGKKIEDIMRELETYNAELEKRQKAKYEKQQKLAVDRLRAQIDGTHIKYKVDIEIERLKGAKFSDDVCVREGQSPKFCGARTEIVPPQSGNTQRMKWMPPALEAKLQATSDPLKLFLNELRVGVSGEVNGQFSAGKTIIIDLPPSRSAKTTGRHTGKIGRGSYTLKVTCKKLAGPTKCTAQPCGNSNETTWINSGQPRRNS